MMSASKFSSYDSLNKIWRGPSRPSIYNTEVGVGYLVLNVLKQHPDRVLILDDDSGIEITCGEIYSRTVKILKQVGEIMVRAFTIVRLQKAWPFP